MTFRLNIYLINIPWDCSSFTKYVQRRLAGNADIDFLFKQKTNENIFEENFPYENGVLFGSSTVRYR